MRRIRLVLVLSCTTPAAHAWGPPGVTRVQPLRTHASRTLTAQQAAPCNLETTRIPVARGEGGRHGDATTSEGCETNVSVSSRRGFLRRVTAAVGAAAATGATLSSASLAGEGRSVADVKKGIEADFISRYAVESCMSCHVASGIEEARVVP